MLTLKQCFVRPLATLVISVASLGVTCALDIQDYMNRMKQRHTIRTFARVSDLLKTLLLLD